MLELCEQLLRRNKICEDGVSLYHVKDVQDSHGQEHLSLWMGLGIKLLVTFEDTETDAKAF